MGTASFPCASTQASAGWAAVHLLTRRLLHPRHQFQVALDVLALGARMAAPRVVGLQVVDALDLTREEAPLRPPGPGVRPAPRTLPPRRQLADSDAQEPLAERLRIVQIRERHVRRRDTQE